MSEFLKRIGMQVSDFSNGLTPARRLAAGATMLFVVVALVWLVMWTTKKTFVPLMTGNLSVEDSTTITRMLREKRIPFKVEQGGKVVEVPPEALHELRMELAMQGMPQNQAVGYEIFDKQSLGATSFVNRLNQKRALEGELVRTIQAIRGVKRARVHLAMPEKSTFVEDQKKTTASVVIDLEPGSQINEKQVFGIGVMVARAIEGMDPSDVVIVDGLGRQLSKNIRDPFVQLNSDQQDFKHKIEEDFEKRIEQMLTRVVGEGRVVAKVTADLDFNQVLETQTILDQDGATIKSNQISNQAQEGSRPSPGGAAGAAANRVADNPAPAAVGTAQNMIKSDTKNSEQRTNYEIPKTERRTQKATGALKRLSVAVVVDGKSINTGEGGQKVEPWTPENLKEFESLIAGAIGLDRTRGDLLEVKNMAFTREDFTENQKAMEATERRQYIQALAMYAVIGLIVLLFFFLVVRPFIRWVTENTTDSVETFLPQTIEELERLQRNSALPGLEDTLPLLSEKLDPDKIEGQMIREKIVSMVEANPRKASLILSEWLQDQTSLQDEANSKPL